MPIQFGSKLSSSIANATFLDKTIDQVKKGKLTLYKINISDPETIDDVQNYINEIATVSGISEENDALSTTYSSEEIIDNGDDRKVAIGKLDAAIKVNQDDITTIEEILASGETVLKAYVDDNAYVIENGSVPFTDKTAIYYNTTSGLIRYYNDVDAQWDDVGKSAVGEHEFLGYGNGANVDFNVTKLPLTDESFIVFKNGVLIPATQYSFSSPTITLNSAPAAGQRIDVWMMTEGNVALSPVIPSGDFQVGYATLTATDITNKNITLPIAPSDVTKVLVDLIGGSAQIYGVDFNVSGTTLNWSGLGLESELVENSVLRYHYFS